MHTGAWCNGSTPDFGSVDLGSNPGAPASYVMKIAFMKAEALPGTWPARFWRLVIEMLTGFAPSGFHGAESDLFFAETRFHK